MLAITVLVKVEQSTNELPQLSLPYSLLVGDTLEIHEDTLKAMWAKAASLVNTSGMITKAPGNTSEFAHMVASAGIETPHYV